MDFVAQPDLPRDLAASVVTVGNFDGVHIGHQALVGRAAALARESGVPALAVTFDPPPAEVLAPQRAPARLMPLPQRRRLLARAGADIVLTLRTTHELLHLTPEEFVRAVLLDRLHARAVIEGYSFRFGRNRSGDARTLYTLGEQLGFRAEIVPPVRARLSDGSEAIVNSSLIRRLVREARMEDAALALGRPYTLFGRVERGFGRGQALGYPTANLGEVQQLLPPDGVYAGSVRIAPGEDPCEPHPTEHAAAVSIGRAPTFDGDRLLIEAHLLDFKGTLYGRGMQIALHTRLRDQERFESPEQLRRKIREDVERVRQILQGRAGPAAPADQDEQVHAD